MNDKIIDEIHKIREENYEKTKNMSYKERCRYIHKGSMEFMKIVQSKRSSGKSDFQEPEAACHQ